jgi:hypothetical protein
MKLDSERRILGCRGDDEPLVNRIGIGIEILSDIEIHGRGSPHRELRAGADADTQAHRLEVIQAVKDGKHLELMVKRARTYRQSKNMKNRRYLRFAADELSTIAPTFSGQPFLVNHDTYAQDSRKGTILTSETETDGRGMTSFFQGFSVVKPDAVISVLDGTIDRFSIGWFPGGEVLCTVHGCDVRGKDSCYCWPGDQVEVDGQLKTVEYEYKGATGKELSAVNVPAVTGTRIEEYRAALSAELQLPTRRPKEKTPMPFPRLAAALKLSVLTEADEPAAVTAVEGLAARALEAEIKVRELTADKATLTAERDAAVKARDVAQSSVLDAVIADGYATGKLGYGKDAEGKSTPDALESMLRDLGAAKGADAVKAKLTAMRISVPVGQRQLTGDIKEPGRALGNYDSVLDSELQIASQQLGIPVDQLRMERQRRSGAR